MSEIPGDLLYTESHEWLAEEDGLYRVGITDYAQSALGEMVFVELPEIDTPLKQGQEAAVVESVKSASDVYSPISGEVVAVNDELTDNPGLVNADPYGDGWLFLIRPEDPDELSDLLDADTYASQLSEND